jgi:hypothetical protein
LQVKAKVTISNRGKSPATLREVRVVVRKNVLYRAIYLLTHLRRFRPVVLAVDNDRKQLVQNDGKDLSFDWGRRERELPPRWPWQVKLASGRWKKREIRVQLLITPRRFSGYHKRKWSSAGFA